MSFNNALKYGQDSAKIYSNMGWSYYWMKKHTKCVEYYELSLNHKAKLNSKHYYLLGNAYKEIGNSLKAQEYIMKSAKMGHADAIAWCKAKGLSYK